MLKKQYMKLILKIKILPNRLDITLKLKYNQLLELGFTIVDIIVDICWTGRDYPSPKQEPRVEIRDDLIANSVNLNLWMSESMIFDYPRRLPKKELILGMDFVMIGPSKNWFFSSLNADLHL